MSVIPILLMFICLVAYLQARYRQQYYFLLVYISTELTLIVAYFMGFGIRGTVPYFLMSFPIFALAYNPISRHVKILSIQVLLICLLFITEFIFPDWVLNPYTSELNVYVDYSLSILSCIGLMFIGIYFLRKSYDELLKKNDEQKELIEENSKHKSMYFINLSHEIKTPLTLIENYLNRYIDRKGEDEELLVMRRNIGKMRRDIVTYLNIENIGRGKMLYADAEVFSLDKFLSEKLEYFSHYANSEHITINNDIEPSVLIKASSDGIDQVLNNLLDNAVKYTPNQGLIHVTLKKETSTAKVIVRNSGAIISADELTHLFEPFYQLSRKKMNAQGIGMGLYTVKSIIDTIGGEISVTSNESIGVEFLISLPLSTENIPTTNPSISLPEITVAAQTTKVSDLTYYTNRSTIMIVEDNADMLRFLAEEFNKTYNVFVAENGVVALQKLENIPIPDLIVSDIMMDEMDGYELFEHTLANNRLAHIPFIFLTAKNEPATKAQGYEMGALDFIAKPFSINDLALKVKSIIDYKARTTNVSLQNMKQKFLESQQLQSKQQANDIFNSNALKYNITTREKEVAQLVKQGLKYDDIAKKLNISEHTVNRHVQNMYDKTNANTKFGLIEKLFN